MASLVMGGNVSAAAQESLSEASSPLDVTFSGARGNRSWVEIHVAASAPVAGVDAQVNGGPWGSLARIPRGLWAGSLSVPDGSIVGFRAHGSNGAISGVAYYRWPASAAVLGESDATGATFAALFLNARGNPWWVEIDVVAGSEIAAVEAAIDGGAWQALAATGWGSWAASLFVPEGSVLVFRARGASGEAATSGGYVWPNAVPVVDMADRARASRVHLERSMQSGNGTDVTASMD